MRVVESTLTKVVEHRAHRHLVFYLPTPVCATLQELRHVPHWLVYWSHSHLPTVTAVVRSLCSLFWSKAFPTLRAPPLSPVSGWWPFAKSGSPLFHFRLLPNIWCHLSLTLSPWTTTPPIYLLLHLFKTRVKRLLLFCLSDRPWRFHVVIYFNSFCLLPSLFSFLIYSPIAVAQIFLSHSLPAWRPKVGVNCPQPYRRQTFGEIVGIAAENTVCQDDKDPLNTICFLRCPGWLALRLLLIFH